MRSKTLLCGDSPLSRTTGLLCSVAATALLGAPALAQEATPAAGPQGGVDRIIITAQKRAEDIQDVPLSVTAFGAEQIELSGVTNMTDLATSVAGLQIDSSNNLRNTSVAIRGIGSSGTNPGIETSVGVFLDGVYLPSGGMIQGELLDISTVEVLRGPQGTLYGRNTPVGAINITTQKPSSEFNAMMRVGAGSHDSYNAGGYVGGALSDNISGRLSGWWRDRGGYVENLFTGEDTNDYSGKGLRGRLLFEPGDGWEVNLIGHWSAFNQQCCVGEQIEPQGPQGIATPGFLAAQVALGFPFRNFNDKDFVVDADDVGNDKTMTWGTSVDVTKDLANGHTFTSISAFEYWNNNVEIAVDSLPQTVTRNFQQQINKSLSQEFRIASPVGQPIEYLGGLFLYNQDTVYTNTIWIGPGANRVFPAAACGVAPCRLRVGDFGDSLFDQDTNSYAAFGTLTWNATNRLALTGGLRYSIDRKKVYIEHVNSPTATATFNFLQRAYTPGSLEREEDNLTWQANAKYRLSDNVMLFATAATGVKAGGFNSRRGNPADPVEFEEETSLTYEAGVKSELFDNRLVLNATAYTMELNDFQESVLNPVTGTGFIVGNAGQRIVNGVELDFRAAPFEGLSLDGAIGWMDAEYTDRPSGQCAVGRTPDGLLPGTCNYNGLTPEKSPKWKGSVGVNWRQNVANDLVWTTRGEMTFTTDFSVEPTLDRLLDIDGYQLWNLRTSIGPDSGRWQVALWGRNLTNEAYYVEGAAQPVAAFVSAGGTAAARGFIGWYGPPRTYGAELTLKY